MTDVVVVDHEQIVTVEVASPDQVAVETGFQGPPGPPGPAGESGNSAELQGKVDKTGFPFDSSGNYLASLAYDETTRTLSISPVSGPTFDIWIGGTKHTYTGTQSITHPDVQGGHFFYFDQTGTLVTAQTPWNILLHAMASYVFWDSANNLGIALDERHHAGRDLFWHRNQHGAEGTKAVSGFGLSGFTLDDGSTDAAITFALASGRLEDEDVVVNTSAIPDGGPYNILYREGAAGEWRVTRGNTLPVMHSGGVLKYNRNNGGVWGLDDVPEGWHSNYRIYGVTAINPAHQIIVVPGQNVFVSEQEANSESPGSILWGSVPFSEVAPLWQIGFRYHAENPSPYTNTAHCAILHAVRITETLAVLNQAVQKDHGTLSGLSDDDHPQYALADGTRGNFEALGTMYEHLQEADPHTQYLQQAEADALYRQAGLITPNDLDTTNAPNEGALMGFSVDTGKFEWLSSTYYQASALTVVAGGITTGNVSYTATKNDGNTLLLQETNATTPGYEYIFDFTTVEIFNQLRAFMRYTGGHNCQIQLWDWVGAAWVTQTTVNNQNGLVDVVVSVDNASTFIGTGADYEKVRVRFYHASAGNASHLLYIDYLTVAHVVAGGGGVTHHSALAGIRDADVHPATSISATAHGTNVGTTVQAQLNELADGKVQGSGVAKITVGTTEPTTPAVGDLWIDTN